MTTGSMQIAWTAKRAAVISADGTVAIASLAKISISGENSTERSMSIRPMVTSEDAVVFIAVPFLSAGLSGACRHAIAPIGEGRDGRRGAGVVQGLVPGVLIYFSGDTGEAMSFQMV